MPGSDRLKVECGTRTPVMYKEVNRIDEELRSWICLMERGTKKQSQEQHDITQDH